MEIVHQCDPLAPSDNPTMIGKLNGDPILYRRFDDDCDKKRLDGPTNDDETNSTKKTARPSTDGASDHAAWPSGASDTGSTEQRNCKGYKAARLR